jgi:hypothetical protein
MIWEIIRYPVDLVDPVRKLNREAFRRDLQDLQDGEIARRR